MKFLTRPSFTTSLFNRTNCFQSYAQWGILSSLPDIPNGPTENSIRSYYHRHYHEYIRDEYQLSGENT